jgi:hypothetical protein
MNYQGITVVSREDAARRFSVPLRKIDDLGVNAASQPEPLAGRLRYFLDRGEKYFVLADIEMLDKRERELRAKGPV